MSLLTYPITNYARTLPCKKHFPNQTLQSIYNLFYLPYQSQLIPNIFTTRNDTNVEFTLIQQAESTLINDSPVRYVYTLVHPVLKKILFGPSQVNIKEEYFIFLENNKLIVEVTTLLSGFMLMDTFVTRTLYIYSQVSEKEVELEVKLDVEFIKENMFKKVVEKNAYEENEQQIPDVFFKEMDKIIEMNKGKDDEDKDDDKKSIETQHNEDDDDDNDETVSYWCYYYYCF